MFNISKKLDSFRTVWMNLTMLKKPFTRSVMSTKPPAQKCTLNGVKTEAKKTKEWSIELY